MTMTTRILWAFGVICIAMFVLASGRTNVRNYSDIQASIEQIYADRLVVKGLIFELSTMLHDKEIAQLTGDASFYASENPTVDARIDEQLELFRATRLTETESTTLDRFTAQLADLREAERAYPLAQGAPLEPEQARVLAEHMGELEADLRELSRIQLKEGKRRVAIGERAEADMTFIFWVEAILMLLFAAQLIFLFFIPGAPRRGAAGET